jgi:flagellar assembly protein FliH
MSEKGTVDYLPWRAPEIEDSRALHAVDSEAARKLAWEQAYNDGYTIGVEAGTRDARQRMAYLHEILESLARPFRDLDESVASQLTTLVRTLAEALVRREIELDQSVLNKLVDEGLQALPVSESEVRIVVNPEDAAMMNEYLEEHADTPWRVQSDATVSRGGCQIFSKETQIDATVETRLARLVERMLDAKDSANADH